MNTDFPMSALLGVVGTGLMGRGIAQIAAQDEVFPSSCTTVDRAVHRRRRTPSLPPWKPWWARAS